MANKPLAPTPNATPDNVLVQNAAGEPSKNTTTVERMGRQAADPAAQPLSAHPYAPKERHGATYGIQVGFEAHTEPSASATTQNGHVVPSAINRSLPNFQMGATDLH